MSKMNVRDTDDFRNIRTKKGFLSKFLGSATETLTEPIKKLATNVPEFGKIELQTSKKGLDGTEEHLERREVGIKGAHTVEPDDPEYVVLNEKTHEILLRRNQLENTILDMIGGKTGMEAIWHEIESGAQQGDVHRFQSFARSFPHKTKILKGYYDELVEIISGDKYKLNAVAKSDKRFLFQPFYYDETCQKLFRNNRYLVDSGLLHKDILTPEDLKRWCSELEKTKCEVVSRE